MKTHTFKLTAGLIFLLVTILHFARVVNDWTLVVGGYAVPMWLSWVAFILTGYLAYTALKKK